MVAVKNAGSEGISNFIEVDEVVVRMRIIS